MLNFLACTMNPHSEMTMSTADPEKNDPDLIPQPTPARERSILAFWMLMPAVFAVLAAIVPGLLVMIFAGTLMLFVPVMWIVAFLILAACGLATAGMVAMCWLWVALWRPENAPPMRVGLSRVFVLAGGALAAFSAMYAVDSVWPSAPHYHSISPSPAAFVEALAAAAASVIALILAWPQLQPVSSH
jgi:hypothetical protein